MSSEPPTLPCVLVVDDDFVDREMVRRMAQSAYRLLEAGSIEEGRELLAEGPDVVLLDHRIGPEDGVGLVQEFQSRGVPVVMMSGQLNPELQRRSAAAGVAALLPKDSLTREELVGALDRARGASGEAR